ncbi:MAG: thioredoxin-disulfide reductase [Deltaproteobacteria bacterium]|nr:thioredoxin-disulfide reductase [Deltaproteobacteria bacterium]
MPGKHAKVVIVGSGPAGLTAAIYAARANLQPLVVEGLQPGGQLTITTDVENYPGFPEGVTGPELMDRTRKQAERFGTEFVSGDVVKVDLAQRPFTLALDGGEAITGDTLIVAAGATAHYLGTPSETRYRGRGVSACATCDGFFYRGKPVAVVGGGDTALEEALHLAHFASAVTVIHRRGELRASRYMQERAHKDPKLSFAWHSVIAEVLGVEGKGVTGVRLRDVRDGAERTLAVDGLFIAIGHQPNTGVFRGLLEMDEVGYLKVTPGSTRTSVAGVFAAGDVADPVYRQAITAAGTGCMAAIEAERFLLTAGH